MNALEKIEKLVVVHELGTDNEYSFVNSSRKSALLTAYAMSKGYMSNLIKNNYKKIDGKEISEGKYSYAIGDFTVMKKPTFGRL